jgi:hypothetical protein
MTTRTDGRIYAALAAAQTLSGREIYRRGTDRQNHFRARLSELSWSVVSSLERHGLRESLLIETVAKLRIAKDDPRHYGDNKPGTFFDDERHTPVVPDPCFSHWNLYEYGVTGEGGFNGFISLTGIDPAIDDPTLCGLIAPSFDRLCSRAFGR